MPTPSYIAAKNVRREVKRQVEHHLKAQVSYCIPIKGEPATAINALVGEHGSRQAIGPQQANVYYRFTRGQADGLTGQGQISRLVETVELIPVVPSMPLAQYAANVERLEEILDLLRWEVFYHANLLDSADFYAAIEVARYAGDQDINLGADLIGHVVRYDLTARRG